VSDQEQQFGELVQRVFNDPAFAKSMQQHPAEALKQAGYHLTPEQIKAISETKTVSGEALNISIVRPVVNIITKGTKPVVTVVTKGTQPVVSVVTGTVVVAKEAMAHPDKLLTAEEVAKEAKK